MLPTLSEMEDD